MALQQFCFTVTMGRMLMRGFCWLPPHSTDMGCGPELAQSIVKKTIPVLRSMSSQCQFMQAFRDKNLLIARDKNLLIATQLRVKFMLGCTMDKLLLFTRACCEYFVFPTAMLMQCLRTPLLLPGANHLGNVRCYFQKCRRLSRRCIK